MPKTLVVNVTKADIRKGVAGNPNACPVARAICRSFRLPLDNAARFVSVGAYEVLLIALHEKQIKLPRSVQTFTERFDRKGLGKPFSFRLRLP